jgi:hypothetical protein
VWVCDYEEKDTAEFVVETCKDLPCVLYAQVHRVGKFGVSVIYKVKAIRACGFQEVEAPRFEGKVRLSAERTDRLYPLGNICGTYFC